MCFCHGTQNSMRVHAGAVKKPMTALPALPYPASPCNALSCPALPCAFLMQGHKDCLSCFCNHSNTTQRVQDGTDLMNYPYADLLCRNGTVPVVHKAGRLNDAIFDMDADQGQSAPGISGFSVLTMSRPVTQIWHYPCRAEDWRSERHGL